MTNADVIRQMSDEDLQDFLITWENGGYASDYPVAFCDLCEQEGGNTLGLDCDGCILHWLKRDSNDTGGLSFSFKTKKLVDVTDENKHREPTDAIPIEWIVKRVKEIEREWDYHEAVLIADKLIEDWRKENGLNPVPTISERLGETIPFEWIEKEIKNFVNNKKLNDTERNVIDVLYHNIVSDWDDELWEKENEK